MLKVISFRCHCNTKHEPWVIYIFHNMILLLIHKINVDHIMIHDYTDHILKRLKRPELKMVAWHSCYYRVHVLKSTNSIMISSCLSVCPSVVPKHLRSRSLWILSETVTHPSWGGGGVSDAHDEGSLGKVRLSITGEWTKLISAMHWSLKGS